MGKQEDKIMARSVQALDTRTREALIPIVKGFVTGVLVGLEQTSGLVKTPAGWSEVQIQYHCLQRFVAISIGSAIKSLMRVSDDVAGMYAAETLTMIEEAINEALKVDRDGPPRIFTPNGK